MALRLYYHAFVVFLNEKFSVMNFIALLLNKNLVVFREDFYFLFQ
jgi:hypothetical protein